MAPRIFSETKEVAASKLVFLGFLHFKQSSECIDITHIGREFFLMSKLEKETGLNNDYFNIKAKHNIWVF